MTENVFVHWLMGPTSAGKTTIGLAFTQRLRDNAVPSIHLDGDEVRSILGDSLGFTPEDRFRNVSLYVHLANKCLDAGLNVVVSALTAHQRARRFVTDNVRNLVLVYLECPLEVCIERDSRGLYRKARAGEIAADSIVGLTKPYPAPARPDLMLPTSRLSVEQSVDRLYRHFASRCVAVD